eukprot:NODE_121_length_18880_cov_0.205687.p14 type:complete len:106 gc:universal NODE_121_length_18880_cov_0.205687:16853-17170(+)
MLSIKRALSCPEQSVIASVEDYLTESTVDKDIDILNDTFCEDQSIVQEVLQEFKKTGDPVWVCVELYYSKTNPITEELLSVPFSGNLSPQSLLILIILIVKLLLR